MISGRHLTGWLFTTALFTVLIIPLLARDGMFFDGTIYASISRNMAEGTGSFWSPYYTATLDPDFHDSPPLAFGVQSLFFKVFGDHFWVEGSYCLLVALLGAALTVKLWQRVPGAGRRTGWVPVILWLAIPLIHWSYTNNMLENTMTVFCLSALLFQFKSIETDRRYAWQLAAAIMIFCAFMTKGFTGLFPFAFYFIYWLVFRRYSFMVMVRHSVVLVVLTCIIAAPFFIIDPAAHALCTYLDEQVVRSISGSREVDGHFFILGKLSRELAVVAGFTFIALLMLRAIKQRAASDDKKYSLFFFLTALSGSLPVMISPKQSGFYVLAALPLFALSAAALIYPLFTGAVRVKPIIGKIISGISVIAIACVIVWSIIHFGEPRRDEEMLNDIKLIGQTIDSRIIRIAPELEYDWNMHACLMRHAHISAKGNAVSKWYLSEEKLEAPAGYSAVDVPLKVYRLYKVDH